MSNSDSRDTADPNQASPGTSQHPRKKCQACCAMYPISYFTLTKYSKDGCSPQCKLCYNQYVRLNRRVKYGSKSSETHDDSVIRSSKIHNKTLISLAIAAVSCRFYALDTLTKRKFIVDFGVSSRLSFPSMTLLEEDGSFICEFSYVNTEAHIETLARILRNKNLRLEKSLDDVELSKRTIYYL